MFLIPFFTVFLLMVTPSVAEEEEGDTYSCDTPNQSLMEAVGKQLQDPGNYLVFIDYWEDEYVKMFLWEYYNGIIDIDNSFEKFRMMGELEEYIAEMPRGAVILQDGDTMKFVSAVVGNGCVVNILPIPIIIFNAISAKLKRNVAEAS